MTAQRAILIGNDAYESGPLRSSRASTAELASALTDPQAGLFSDDDVELLMDVTEVDVVQALHNLHATSQDIELLLIYFIGRTLNSASGELLLLSVDTEPSVPILKGVAVSDLIDLQVEIGARTLVLIVDGSGERLPTDFAPHRLPFLQQQRQRSTDASWWIASAERGAEKLQEGRYISPFTRYLVEAMTNGEADLDRNGLVDIKEAFDYISQRLRHDGHPTPQLTQQTSHNAAIPGLAKAPMQSGEGEEPGDYVDWAQDSPARADSDALSRRPIAVALRKRLTRLHDTTATSFMVHVDGEWGSGKTTLLNLLQDELEPQWLVVPFDAWRQSRVGPPWWSLLGSLSSTIASTKNRRERVRLRVGEAVARFRAAGVALQLTLLLFAALVGILYWFFRSGGVSLDNVESLAGWVVAASGGIAVLWAVARLLSSFFLWESAKGALFYEQSSSQSLERVAQHFLWLTGRVNHKKC